MSLIKSSSLKKQFMDVIDMEIGNQFGNYIYMLIYKYDILLFSIKNVVFFRINLDGYIEFFSYVDYR